MAEREIEVKPWFADDGERNITVLALENTEKVAYSWTHIPDRPDEPKTIDHLLVWHDCDHTVWLSDPAKDQSRIDDYNGWTPAGVGLHTLIAVDPLHIEASVYWPDCCGMHGWIRDGAWVPA